MSKPVKAIPEGYHSVTPYLTVNDGKAALDFYVRAFGASVRMQMPGPNGRMMHAEIVIGDSVIMLSDEFPEMGATSPTTLGGRTSAIVLYVEGVDAAVERAVAAGAKILRPVADQFYGDRMGTLQDPFGQVWSLGTHIEDVSPEEMQRRMAAMQ